MKNKSRINIFSLLITLCWTCAIVISALYTIGNITKKQNNLVLEHAKNAYEKDLMFRKWVAMHGGVYVFPTKKTPPNPYLAHLPNRDLETKTGVKLTLMNPAYTLRELMENFSGMYGEKGHITSLKLLNPNNKADKWETKVLKGFDKKEFTQFHEIYNYKGSEHLRYMKALTVKPNCLKCHAHQGYVVGDIRGGVSITIPMKKYNNDGDIEKKNVIYIHLIILILSYLIGFIAYKKIIKTLAREEKAKKELRNKNKILQEQVKLASMGEMIGNIAHQWRQPLSVISTGATGLKLQKEFDSLTDEFFFEACDTIDRNAQYLSKTIDDFRNFIKGDRKKAIFNLKNEIDSFLNLVGSSIKSSNINIILNLEKDIEIDGYKNELTQCLINLFNNAKDAFKEKEICDKSDSTSCHENKLVFISTYQDKDKVIITFKDNAGGIPNDILSKVFEPYFTTKHKSQGTGLGLNITHNLIVDGMGGSIEANNVYYKYKGKEYAGAEFKIVLPLGV